MLPKYVVFTYVELLIFLMLEISITTLERYLIHLECNLQICV